MRRVARRLLRGPFESAVAVSGVASCLTWMIAPDQVQRAAVGQTAPTLFPWWECMFGASGVLILAGLLGRSVRLEVCGLVLLAAALLMNAISIVNFTGVTGVTAATTYGALVIASLSRAWFLVQGWRTVRDRP